MSQETKQDASFSSCPTFWSFDLETGGQPEDGSHSKIFAVGRAWKSPITGHVEKKRFVLPFNRDDITPGCWKNFWSKPENLKALEILEASPKVTIKEVIADLDECDAVTLKETGLVMLPLTDTPSFDAHLLNVAFEKVGRKPIHFTSSGSFRPVMDIGSAVAMFMWRKFGYDGKFWFGDSIKESLHVQYEGVHDHLPENDAENNLNKAHVLLQCQV